MYEPVKGKEHGSLYANGFLGEKLNIIRDGAAVKRFHTMRTSRTQTVGEHSYGVAMLVTLVEPDCSVALLKAALTHDLHEQSTGDIPSPAKWRYPELAAAMAIAEERWEIATGLRAQLTAHEVEVLKFCDYLELLIWAIEECRLGNEYAQLAVTNMEKVLNKMLMPTQAALELYSTVRLNELMGKS
jgi:5'-deoxynucleotidase YfbR-like HD superfamily hydrolase